MQDLEWSSYTYAPSYETAFPYPIAPMNVIVMPASSVVFHVHDWRWPRSNCAGYKIVCYLGSWAIYRPEPMSFRPRDVQAKGCTHLIYSFAGLDNTTLEMVSLDPVFDIKKGKWLVTVHYYISPELTKINSQLILPLCAIFNTFMQIPVRTFARIC